MRHMRSEAPPLVPIFRSALQARVLLEVLTRDDGITAAELARRLGSPEPTVSREVRRLVDAGLLRGDRVGRAVLLHPSEDNPAIAPLRQLLVVTYGPARIIEQALTGMDGIDRVFIHGSWAARFHGEPGRAPGDVDVLVVGQPKRLDVDEALDSLEAQLGREVNVTYVSAERWGNVDDPFVSTVRSRPLVELHVAPTSTAAAAT